MAVDARSMGAPSRASEIHRRGLLAGLAAIPAAFAAVPVAAESTLHTAWDADMRSWRLAKYRTDVLWAQIQGRPMTDAECDQLDTFSADECAVWNRLMQMPAPHTAALCWKIEQTMTPDEDGYSGSWAAIVANRILDDARRLSRP